MMFKHCCKCGMPATVTMQGLMYCSQHAFDRIQSTKGPVKLGRLK